MVAHWWLKMTSHPQSVTEDNKDNGVASTTGFAPMQEENLGVHDDCRGVEGALDFPSLSMTTRSSNSMALETATTQERSVSFLMEDNGGKHRAADGSSRESIKRITKQCCGSWSQPWNYGITPGCNAWTCSISWQYVNLDANRPLPIFMFLLLLTACSIGFSISWRLSRSYWWGMVLFGGLTLATNALF